MTPSAASPERPADPSRSPAVPAIVVVVIVIAALLTLWPVAKADFTLWDDPHTVAQNPHLNPPTFAGLKFHWMHAWQELYVPLTYTAWWGLATVAQVKNADGTSVLNPWIFHSANLLVHIVSSLIVLKILWRLLGDGSVWLACAGAMLFALHPVQVETVAWVSGLKDLLCGMFCLIAIEQYLAAPGEWSRQYIVALLAFVVAMLSKPTAVALPVVLVAIDLVLRQKRIPAVMRSVMPFALLAVPCMIWTRHFQPAWLIAPIPLWWRPFVAGDAIAYYLLKIVAPVHLAIDYGRSPQSVITSRVAMVTWIVPVVLAVLVWRLRDPRTRTGGAIFVGALLPVLGLVPFEFQAKSTVGDHYLYLPMLGVALVFAAAMARLSGRAAIGVTGVIMLLLAMRSFSATWDWQDSRRLFTHTLAVNPRSAVAENNLLVLAVDENNADEALRRASRLMELAPDDPITYDSLGRALGIAGQPEKAADVYRQAIARWPLRVEGYQGMAAALRDLGRPAEAIEQYGAALQIDPNNATIVALRNQTAARLAATQPATR